VKLAIDVMQALTEDSLQGLATHMKLVNNMMKHPALQLEAAQEYHHFSVQGQSGAEVA
jgi:hypothetical protein